jgi:hypothetical protein
MTIGGLLTGVPALKAQYSSYSTRRVFGPIWRWQASVAGHGEQGLSLGRSSARWAARTAIREHRRINLQRDAEQTREPSRA